MAINTQSELITHLKYLTGQDNLNDADARRLLNFALDDYTYIAITSDGNWQWDDSSNTDIPRATATLAANQVKLELPVTFLAIQQVTITDSTGNINVIEPYDQAKRQQAVPRTQDTGQPNRYDYMGGYMYFDAYADQDYTVTVHYSRPAIHLEADNDSQVVGIPTIHTEYLVFHAAHRLGIRNADNSLVQFRNEMVEMERKIRDFYGKRDEDTPKRIRAINKVIT